MRLALFALLLTLPLAACDPDARVDGNTPDQTTADDIEFDRGQVEMQEDEPGGDTGLPDPDTSGVLTPPIVPQTEDAPGDTGLPDSLR